MKNVLRRPLAQRRRVRPGPGSVRGEAGGLRRPSDAPADMPDGQYYPTASVGFQP